jgi:hypothetical protein
MKTITAACAVLSMALVLSCYPIVNTSKYKFEAEDGGQSAAPVKSAKPNTGMDGSLFDDVAGNGRSGREDASQIDNHGDVGIDAG